MYVYDRHETVIGVSAGDSHSLVNTLEGAVYGWGCYKDREGKEFFNATSERQVGPSVFSALVSSMSFEREMQLSPDRHIYTYTY